MAMNMQTALCGSGLLCQVIVHDYLSEQQAHHSNKCLNPMALALQRVSDETPTTFKFTAACSAEISTDETSFSAQA